MRNSVTLTRAAITTSLALLLATVSILYLHYFRQPAHTVPGGAKLHLNFTAHSDGIWSVMFSPRGDLIASGSIDGTAKIWRVADGQVIQDLKHPHGVTALAFSRDGEYLATTSYDSQVRLWRTADGSLVKTLSGHDKTVWFVEFSPDGKTVASSGEDKTSGYGM